MENQLSAKRVNQDLETSAWKGSKGHHDQRSLLWNAVYASCAITEIRSSIGTIEPLLFGAVTVL
jgi:hypothetical protein